jgi:hypothetical protein
MSLFRCSTWLSYGPYGPLRTGVEKEFGGLSQLAIPASSNQPFDLKAWDPLSATVFLENNECSISLLYAPFYEQPVKPLSHDILVGISPYFALFQIRHHLYRDNNRYSGLKGASYNTSKYTRLYWVEKCVV